MTQSTELRKRSLTVVIAPILVSLMLTACGDES